jgi:hypothetical protein
MNKDILLILLICLPPFCGGVIALANSDGTNEFTEKIETWIRKRHGIIAAKKGFFWKWIARPPFWLCVALSNWSDSLAHRGLKNGIRLAVILYILALWLVLLMYAFLLLVCLALAVMAVYTALWIIGKVSGQNSPSLLDKRAERKSDEALRTGYVPDPADLEKTYNEAQKIGLEGGTWNPFQDVWRAAFESEASYNARKDAWEKGMENGLKNRSY